MFEHRFRELIAQTTPTAVAVAPVGFMPCPYPVVAAYTPMQIQCVAEIYRLAWALTEAQLAKPTLLRIPEFSMN